MIDTLLLYIFALCFLLFLLIILLATDITGFDVRGFGPLSLKYGDHYTLFQFNKRFRAAS